MNHQPAKSQVERQLQLDVRLLKRQGSLEPGKQGLITWTKGSREVARIHFACEASNAVRVLYKASRTGTSSSHNYCLELLPSTCHLGGQRLWFACPDCCRRVAILYLFPPNRRFTCRLCARLNYASQQQSREDTLIDRAHKLRARLGCTGGLFRPSLSELKKPRYMRWPKFWETLHQLNYLEQQVVAEMCASLNLPPP